MKKQVENILSKIDKSNWEFYKFGDFAFNISERVEPNDTKLKIYVGLEHLDPRSIHIRRTGIPSDVEGTKLKVYKGDIIFGKRRAYQRKAAIATFDGICSAHSMVLRANPKIIDPNLFPFFIHSDIFMNRAVDISEGSLSPTIKWKILSEQKFCLPPQPLQKKLAELLWTIDASLEIKREVLKQLHITRKVLTKNLFMGGPENKTNVPKKWKEMKMGDICKIRTGKKDVNEGNPRGLYPFFTCSKNYTYSDNYSFDTEAILIAGNGEVGNLHYYVGKFEAYQRTYVLSDFKCNVSYLYFYLDRFLLNSLIKEKIGSAIPYIKLNALYDFLIKIPTSIEDQKKIVNELLTIDKTIDNLKKNIDNENYLINYFINQ